MGGLCGAQRPEGSGEAFLRCKLCMERLFCKGGAKDWKLQLVGSSCQPGIIARKENLQIEEMSENAQSLVKLTCFAQADVFPKSKFAQRIYAAINWIQHSCCSCVLSGGDSGPLAFEVMCWLWASAASAASASVKKFFPWFADALGHFPDVLRLKRYKTSFTFR